MDITKLLHQQNPWWVDPGYRPEESKWFRRELFAAVDSTMPVRQITAIVGLRRVGKSTLIKQLLSKVLDIAPSSSVLYFSFEQPTVSKNADTIVEIVENYLERVINKKIHEIERECFIFFDEIQLVPGWQGIIKRYYDLSPKIKFVVTGSSSLFLRRYARESLAGRIFTYTLDPLSWKEFQTLYPDVGWDFYLHWGGFPETTKLPDLNLRKKYLDESVIRKVIDVDLPIVTRIRNTLALERIFWSLLPNTSYVIDIVRMGQDLQIKKSTLHNYLDLLEDTLLIRRVANMSGSFRSPGRLLRKYYPASPNLLNLTSDVVTEGAWAESLAAQLLGKNFPTVEMFRSGGQEIDFIIQKEKLAIEVKYQNNINSKDCKTLKDFATDKHYRPLVLTRDFLGKVEGIECLPLREWAQKM